MNKPLFLYFVKAGARVVRAQSHLKPIDAWNFYSRAAIAELRKRGRFTIAFDMHRFTLMVNELGSLAAARDKWLEQNYTNESISSSRDYM